MGSSRCHARIMRTMCRCLHVVAVERFLLLNTTASSGRYRVSAGVSVHHRLVQRRALTGRCERLSINVFIIAKFIQPRLYKFSCFPCVCSSGAMPGSKRCPPNKESHLVLTASKFASAGVNLASQTRKLPTPLAAPLYSRAATLRASELMWSRSRSPAETPCAVSIFQDVPVQAHRLHSRCCNTCQVLPLFQVEFASAKGEPG